MLLYPALLSTPLQPLHNNIICLTLLTHQFPIWFNFHKLLVVSACLQGTVPHYNQLHLFFQVSKERVRVLEFMRDYDKLRSGRIPMTSFRRALDLCGFELTQAEVGALEKRCVLYY